MKSNLYRTWGCDACGTEEKAPDGEYPEDWKPLVLSDSEWDLCPECAPLAASTLKAWRGARWVATHTEKETE
jgi:hypothetical protein